MKGKYSITFFKSLLVSGFKLWLIPVLLICYNTSYAQLTTDDSPIVDTLIKHLVGNGVQVSNIKYTGDPTARGLFNGATSNIDLKSGIILSTGAIDSATGPDHSPSNGSCNHYNSGTDFVLPGDEDLDVIEGCVSSCTIDAAVLEFDFVPQSSPLSFTYVFASNEYPCYVCNYFNDIFAFLISGPNPLPGPAYYKKNIAIIPSSNPPTYVTINSVNSGIPGPGSSTKDCTSIDYSNKYVDNGNGSTPLINSTVAYHGFTVPFIATIPVVPCKTYHLKLAIADFGDGYYDSAVLLKANSLASPSASDTVSYSYNNTAIEGCSDASICYYLPDTLSSDYKIPLTFSGTAVIGTDYNVTGVPSTNYNSQSATVTIPAGQKKSCISISAPILPGNTIKQAIITSKISTCGTKADIISIMPNTALTIAPKDSTISICKETPSVSISVKASGGISSKPYHYIWSNSDTLSNINVPPSSATYTVTATDNCGTTAKTNIIVNVITQPPISIKDTIICAGNTATLVLKGTNNVSNYKWSTGETTSSIKVNPVDTIKYFVTVEYAYGCYISDSVTVYTTPPPIANFNVKNNSGCSPLTVTFTDSSKFTNASSTYLWNFGDGQISNKDNIVHTYTSPGKYTVSYTVSNAANGCSNTKTVVNLIDVYPDPEAKFYVEPNKNVSELDPTIFAFSNSSGGITSYQWNISDTNITFTDSSITHTFKNAGTYTVTLHVLNKYGCKDSISATIYVESQYALYVPNAFLPSRCKESQNCWFMVKGEHITDYQIWIYNRWGELVYNSKTLNEGWDGKLGGNLCKEGVYVYRIDYKGIHGILHTIWGNVTLLR